MESTNSLLIIAPEAKLRIEEALAERGVPYFRVYIQGGGCSGYSYQFDVASEKNADDFEISKLIKEHIKHYLGSLNEIFVENQGKDFLVKHAKKIDQFIILTKLPIIQHYAPGLN